MAEVQNVSTLLPPTPSNLDRYGEVLHLDIVVLELPFCQVGGLLILIITIKIESRNI